MIRIPVYEVVVGESLPALSVWAMIDNSLISGLDSGATFLLTVKDPTGATTVFTKSTDITGQTGSGTSPTNGTPNIVITWETTGELDQLTADRTHRSLLEITRADGGLFRFPFALKAVNPY